MTIRTASEADVQFIADHEGFVSKAYRCPAGVVTIGYGFTMGSKVFAAYWRQKHGRALRMGDTITRAEANTILRRVINEEYGAAVARQIAPKQQHHFGGSTSMAFNAGIGALAWRWGKALKAGNIKEAARLIRTTATTANGRRMAGLVRRRKEEGDLIEFARYPRGGGSGQPSNRGPETSGATVRQYQTWLRDLGYYNPPLKVDGVRGKGTIAAVKKFQKDNGLVVDGKVGSATISTILRALDAKQAGNVNGGAGGVAVTGVGAEGVLNGGLPSWEAIAVGVAIIAVVAVGSWLWRNRGRVTGKRVPVV